MSTVQTLSNPPTAIGAADPMLQGDIMNVADLPSGSDEPNDSYELRDMVSVASSYFDRGMIDDADEMLQEALAAGYTRQDALELNQRIRAILGDAPDLSIAPALDGGDDSLRSQHEFTIPLPGADTQTQTLQRVLRESEIDIRAGRFYSAYDASLNALALAPSYYPIYIRIAELQLALGDTDGAAGIVETLQDCLHAWGDDAGWLMLALRVALDPGDDAALTKLARAVLGLRGTVKLEPYVPDAIQRMLSADAATALELAQAYMQLQPHDPAVSCLLLRTIVATGDTENIKAALAEGVASSSPADLLFVRAALEYAESPNGWLEWLEQAIRALLVHPSDFTWLPRAIDATRQILPPLQHAMATSVVRVAGGDFSGALQVLDVWSQPATRHHARAAEMLIATCARAIALRQISPIESIEAFADAVGQAVVIDVRPFADSCKLFEYPISAEALMQQLVDVAKETGQQDLAIMHLQALRDRLPEHLEIRTGLADLQIAAGRVSDGIRELRHIAERYEQAGNLNRMVDAMRHISNAVPRNVEIKAKLIEGYIHRGIPDEAARELRLLGDLLLERNNYEEAAAAYRRGAEIAATTGSIRRAMDLFDRAVDAAPENVSTRHAAVAFFIMNGAVDKATQQLREVVRIALQQNDPDEAVAALHQIIGLAPSDVTAYHRLGEVLTSLGEYTQAERVYRRLAAITPDDPVLVAKQSALAALSAEQG